MRGLFLVAFFLTLQGCAATSEVVTTGSLDISEDHADGRIVHRDLSKPYTEKPDSSVLIKRYENAVEKLEESLNAKQSIKDEQVVANPKANKEKLKDITPTDSDQQASQPLPAKQLVVSDPKGIEEEKQQDTLRFFPVNKGTLKLNAERLSELFGLTVAGWKASNFMIDVPYSISFKTVDEGLGMLLKGYPVQAQIIESGIESTPDQVVFVPRRALSTREYK